MSKDEQIAALQLQVDQLSVLLEEALAQVSELKQRLNKNSRNSDKPPSSDGLTKKPAIPRKRGQRKPGGQPGHPGRTLKFSHHPHHTQVHPLTSQSCSCGCSLQDVAAEDHWDRRQVVDLPPTLLEVTEHHVARKTCPACQKVHLADFPPAVNAPVQYGERVRALAILLNVEHSLPLARVQEVFAGLTGYALNESTVHTAVERTYDELATEEELIHQALLASSVAHADETGGRIGGKLHWIHGFGSSRYTYYQVCDKRGGQAINGSTSHLAGFKGRLIHDFLNSYLSMPEPGLSHGLCNAHLLRELTALMDGDHPLSWPGQLHELLLEYYRASNYGKGVIEKQQGQELRRRYASILALADEEEPPPVAGKRGRPKQSKGRNLLDRFRDWQDSILAFAYHAEVPFTNNLGERDLRPWKTKLKVSGCFRTVVGAQRYARIKGFCSTVKKHGRLVFDQLVAAQKGESFLRLT